MKCLICGSPMRPYFLKTFNAYGLGDVNYINCGSCGFSASATHLEMSTEEWERLNIAFHRDSEAREDNPYNRNQRYFNQAQMLHLMTRANLIAKGRWLDWGSGQGAVSAQLYRNYDLELHNFDQYMQPALFPLAADELETRGYSLVMNTAVFEHVRSRATLDEIESYVGADGCLAVHTLVRGGIPADPDWMYLLPVHCAFHTNRSMCLLMQQWGYRCSVYNEFAKLWVMFRREPEKVSAEVAALNRSLGWEYLHFKPGFMDFWP